VSEGGDKVVDSRPKRTRIELLVREQDGKGFETREIASGVAYLHSRPQRIPKPDEIEQRMAEMRTLCA
jgi:hypothetical protein